MVEHATQIEPQETDAPEGAHRSRRSLLVAAAGALGAVAAQAVSSAAPVAAATGGNAILGKINTEDHYTAFKNTKSSSTAIAVRGIVTYLGTGSGTAGVSGVSGASSGNGVIGKADHGSGAYGVWGTSNEGTGVFGNGVTGVYGSGTSRGVQGYGPTGVRGQGTGIGVQGVGGSFGVSATGTSYGVFSSSAYVGVWGDGTSTTSATFGVVGRIPTGATGYGGYFYGGVHATAGYSSVGGGATIIDHPVTPDSRFLTHSHVASPDMANIYSGTVTLGAKGTATVRLPAYFEALNGDFRYQLTAIGAAAPNLHVAKEIAGNRFRVAGGQAGQKVSWQVTGIRRDAYARANRMQVVRPKVGKLRGRYVSPELHGKPETAGLGPTRLPRQRGLRIGRPEHKQLPELD